MQIPEEKIGECNMLAKLPHYFSAPIYFINNEKDVMHNATLTLLEFDGDFIGLTCWHVVQQYLKFKKESNTFKFYIGPFEVDPNDLIIDYSEQLDMVTFRLDKRMMVSLKGKNSFKMPTQPITYIYRGEVAKKDIVIFGGLPGEWVQNDSGNSFKFKTFSVGRCPVYSVYSHGFCCEILDPNSWPTQQHKYYRHEEANDLYKPGGISGCPVFIEVVSDPGIIRFEFVGIVCEGEFIMNSTTLVVRINFARFISARGNIQCDDFAVHCSLLKGGEAVEGISDQ